VDSLAENIWSRIALIEANPTVAIAAAFRRAERNDFDD
jgi:hypothetical protein